MLNYTIAVLGLLLYTKCRIATAPPSGEARIQVFQSCCEALESVKENFCKIGAQVRLLQTWYIQVNNNLFQLKLLIFILTVLLALTNFIRTV